MTFSKIENGLNNFVLYMQMTSTVRSECMNSVMSIVHLSRLHRVVMDGRWVPTDVLFFYKTLPLRTGAQGRVCHACDE